MIDGLWTVEFASDIGLFGRGVLIAKDKKLLGGDAGYYYSGSFHESGDTVEGNIEITRFDPNAISILGDRDTFSLNFKAEITNGTLKGVASLKGKPDLKVNFNGTKREEM